MRGLLRITLFGVFFAFSAACGGPSDSPPGPLTTHFDDMYIAAIPLDQKQQVVQTQNDWNIARMENANAEAQLKESDAQVHQAQNDQKASRLAIDSAVSAKKSAEASADMNRINNAQKDLHTAEDLGKAADARVKYLDTYRAYLKKWARYTAENMYWREAQYEQAKAQLAKQNNIQPKGVVYDKFPGQLDERAKRTQKAKGKAETDKENTVAARETWLKIQDQADKESGHQSSLWDPMAPKTAGNVPETKPTPQPELKSAPQPQPQPQPQPEGAGSGGSQ